VKIEFELDEAEVIAGLRYRVHQIVRDQWDQSGEDLLRRRVHEAWTRGIEEMALEMINEEPINSAIAAILRKRVKAVGKRLGVTLSRTGVDSDE
jgi:hypothetical protein